MFNMNINYDEWIRLGERLGLKGEALTQFVKEKEEEYLAREERAQRRDSEQRERERSHELLLKDKELELEKIKQSKPAIEPLGIGPKPKLPPFNEQVDDIDAYISRFERHASSMGWGQDTWAVCLSPLLSGKGLETYSSLSVE